MLETKELTGTRLLAMENGEVIHNIFCKGMGIGKIYCYVESPFYKSFAFFRYFDDNKLIFDQNSYQLYTMEMIIDYKQENDTENDIITNFLNRMKPYE